MRAQQATAVFRLTRSPSRSSNRRSAASKASGQPTWAASHSCGPMQADSRSIHTTRPAYAQPVVSVRAAVDRLPAQLPAGELASEPLVLRDQEVAVALAQAPRMAVEQDRPQVRDVRPPPGQRSDV